MNPLTIISVKFTDSTKKNVEVITANKVVKVVTVQYLWSCIGCDVITLDGAIGEIWD
jgi:hypothetical protein